MEAREWSAQSVIEAKKRRGNANAERSFGDWRFFKTTGHQRDDARRMLQKTGAIWCMANRGKIVETRRRI